MAQAFQGRIIQIHVRQLDFALRQRVGIYRKVVVVRRDLNFPGLQLLYGMIAAMVSELQLVGSAAQGDSHELMSQTDTENRLSSH